MDFTNAELITSVDVNDNILNFRSALLGSYQNFTATIEIILTVTGIRFSSGEAINANGHKWQTGDKIVIGFFPNLSDLRFQADDIGDTFVITVS